MKNVVELDKYYSPWELERALGRFVEHYNHRRYQESLDNVTPADAYHGRRQQILARREQVRKKTMARRKRQNLRAVGGRGLNSGASGHLPLRGGGFRRGAGR